MLAWIGFQVLSLAGKTPLPRRQDVRLVIMTVSAATALGLRGRLDVKVPKKVFNVGCQSIEEIVNPETGDVTFSLCLRPRGFAFSVR